MAKFMQSIGDQTFQVLAGEAGKRDVTVQQLLRAVILPEWVKKNVELHSLDPPPREVAPYLTRSSMYRSQQEPLLVTSVDRARH
jgi:hypothetical protein